MDTEAKSPPPHVEQDWPPGPATREGLDAALAEGFASERCALTHEEIIAQARRELGLA